MMRSRLWAPRSRAGSARAWSQLALAALLAIALFAFAPGAHNAPVRAAEIASYAHRVVVPGIVRAGP